MVYYNVLRLKKKYIYIYMNLEPACPLPKQPSKTAGPFTSSKTAGGPIWVQTVGPHIFRNIPGIYP